MNESPAEKLRNAACEGNLQDVKSLIPLLDPQKRREELSLAIRGAVFNGHLPVVDCMLEAGADPNAKGLVGSLLMVAAGFGHLPVIKRLIEAGADIHARVSGENAVGHALSCDKPEIADYLKSLGADWATPTLLYASRKGDLTGVKEALSAGANINAATGPEGKTALMMAAHKGQATVVRYLLKNGANPNIRIKEWTALMLAACFGKNLETVEALIGAGADIHAKFFDETVLMFAAQGGCLPIVKRLVELGADVHARDKDHGKTALDYAKDGKHKDVIACLGGLGLVAMRDPGRALVRALAREYGGKPVEHVHGFMLNAKFAGTKCQFHVQSDGCAVVVLGLKYIDAELRRSQEWELVIGMDKPGRTFHKLGPVKAANKTLGLMIFRSPGGKGPSEKFVSGFCARHCDKLRRLALAAKESIGITAKAARFTWMGTDMNSVQPRLETFASLLKEISRPPQPERRLFEREWLIKPAAKAAKTKPASRHSLGGAWAQPVACPHCGAATNLMARMDLSDPVLPKTSLGRGQLPVFWCLKCLGWDATFFDISGPVPKPFNAGGKKAKPGKIKTGEENLEEEFVMLVPVAAGKKAGHKSKVGGSPAWIQLEATPDCPRCKKPMAFVLQLASDSRISYCDMGMLHAFACSECRITASLVQSH